VSREPYKVPSARGLRYYPPTSAKVAKGIVVHLGAGGPAPGVPDPVLDAELEAVTACGRVSDVAFVTEDESEATCGLCLSRRRKSAAKAARP
jgi:hypothetical protein